MGLKISQLPDRPAENGMMIPARIGGMTYKLPVGGPGGIAKTVTPSAPGNLATLDAAGNLGDSGKGLAAFAPSGFGLGEADGKTISSLDEITKFGFYRLPTGLGITPDDASNWGALFVGPNINYGNLIACRGGYVAVMSRAAGVFGPWEWLNPALTVGVEYRTTERHMGKPVYTKLVDFGVLPVNTYKTVDLPPNNIQYVIDSYGITNAGTKIPSMSFANGFWSNVVDVYVWGTGIQIVTKDWNQSSITAVVCIKYTKTTD